MTDLPVVRMVRARPLGPQVLVKVVEEQQGRFGQQMMMVPFSMLLPSQEEQQEKAEQAQAFSEQPYVQPSRGIIVATGPGYLVHTADHRSFVALDLKQGDEVLFFQEKFLRVKINDEDLYLVPEQGILIVLDTMQGTPAVALEHEDGTPWGD